MIFCDGERQEGTPRQKHGGVGDKKTAWVQSELRSRNYQKIIQDVKYDKIIESAECQATDIFRRAPDTEGRPRTGVLHGADAVWRSIGYQCREIGLERSPRRRGDWKAWRRCVSRLLPLINVTRAWTRVEMEKNLQVRAILGEIWTVQTR